MIKVGIAGYGAIGQRLADAVAKQEDMELVGIADVAPTLSIRALREKGMPYALYNSNPDGDKAFVEAGFSISGSFEDLVEKVDIMLDSTPAGVGAQNKKVYEKYKRKAVFQGGESNDIAEVFFHGYANYEKGIGEDYLKLTSCNTTGLIRAVDCLDRAVGVEKVALTIIRRVADPGDYHRGLTNALKVDEAPSHQAVDLMTIMPHIDATGILVQTPVTHGHIITVVATPKEDISVEECIDIFKKHPRIRVVHERDGFLGNASMFKYGRDLGQPRGDLYEIAIFEHSIVKSGNDIMFAIHIPQESITIPETIDAVRAALEMQTDPEEGRQATNKHLELGTWIQYY